ncbi:DUF6284 family protein [Streptomyces sp. NBC_01381]|uniref:DUF6284 family protein n=1 Tax=Streptomyces sp. NBC_01381 TaxID=2903845 RepID=UPI00225748A9|nr:DUF6284 family protein [Streptomyces sp. NBC_01381]MCX4665580.1 DUF6284 family protein [Streptomyces sp. NBC_01381]
MKHIGTVQALVTDRGPTAAELDAIEGEMPLITAEVELLDVQISLLDRPVTELDARRVRRARRKALAIRRTLANRGAASSPEVA